MVRIASANGEDGGVAEEALHGAGGGPVCTCTIDDETVWRETVNAVCADFAAPFTPYLTYSTVASGSM